MEKAGKMAVSNITVRACVYPSPEDSNTFIAHCLELDLIGIGNNVEDALSELFEVVETQLEVCDRTGAQLQYFAPDNVFRVYNESKKAGRSLPTELIERVIASANKRLGNAFPNLFDNVVETNDCMALT